MQLIDKEHLAHPTKGVLQMTSFINGLDTYHVNEKRIRRLMRLMDIFPIYPKQNLSKLGRSEYIRPYLLRNLTVDKTNQVWCIDISYIPMKKGFMYLTAIIDVYSRYIVGWNLSNSLDAMIQTKLLSDCIEVYGAPEIVNSDQGSQYTSKNWIDCLTYYKIKISMDGKGRATDNAFIERFFRSIKQEYIYLNPESDALNLYKGVEKYVEYYNTKRYHQGIQNQIPANKYEKAKGRKNKIINIVKELVY